MKVKVIDIREEEASCNFCRSGILSQSGTSLVYPYDKVFEFRGDKSGIVATICQSCLNELKEKTKDIII